MTLLTTLLTGLLAQKFPQPENMPRIAPQPGSMWLPPQASQQAVEMDWTFNIIYWISMFFLVGITIALIVLVWRYRRKEPNQRPTSNLTHHTVLELTWSIIPLGLVIWMFQLGFTGYVSITTPPAGAMQVHVIGERWKWSFLYPSGCLSEELHMPINTNVQLILESKDVLHSFFIPAMRIKRDAVPGRYTTLWVRPIMQGEFLAECAEYCGTKHSNMLARVVVHPDQASFDAWRIKEEDITVGGTLPPALIGAKLYSKFSCIGCHSLDGSPNTGPTFKGLWTRNEKFNDGTDLESLKKQGVTIEDYIRQSIESPDAKIVATFASPSPMPSFKGRLSDDYIRDLIAFIRTQDPSVPKDTPTSSSASATEPATPKK